MRKERSPGHGVRTRRRVAVAGLLLACVGPITAEGGPQDDDLAIVKRGVQSARSESRGTVSEGGGGKTRPVSRPLWLKVRVVEKGARRAKITLNLPLAVVRALGDDFPVDVGSRRLRLSEILQTLEDGGEPLVQVDDEQSSVRVWVE